MAIKDTTRKPYIVDNDSNVFVGIDLPFRRSLNKEGWFASTSTTIESVKNNIRNLLNTHQGERLMQPTLGLNLRRYLFEQITEDTYISIQDEIFNSFKFWLPFVEIKDIEIITNEMDSTVEPNKLVIKILFNILQDPNTLTSVQVVISDTGTGD
jgi:phage baseplate assembly protein W